MDWGEIVGRGVPDSTLPAEAKVLLNRPRVLGNALKGVEMLLRALAAVVVAAVLVHVADNVAVVVVVTVVVVEIDAVCVTNWISTRVAEEVWPPAVSRSEPLWTAAVASSSPLSSTDSWATTLPS